MCSHVSCEDTNDYKETEPRKLLTSYQLTLGTSELSDFALFALLMPFLFLIHVVFNTL